MFVQGQERGSKKPIRSVLTALPALGIACGCAGSRALKKLRKGGALCFVNDQFECPPYLALPEPSP